MSELIPLNDDESNSADSEQDPNRGTGPRKKRDRRGRTEPGITGAQACLRALSQLPGLIAMGIVKPAEANAMRNTYNTILQHHQRSEDKHAQGQLADEDVLQVRRRSPDLLSMLEPLLTQAQIEMLMQHEADDDEDGHDGEA